MAQFSGRVSFTVPAGAGSYAPEFLTLSRPTASVGTVSLLGSTALIETGVATAVLEMWLLRQGGDPAVNTDYYITGKNITASGSETFSLAGWHGVQWRAKSGGTAGSMLVSATAD